MRRRAVVRVSLIVRIAPVLKRRIERLASRRSVYETTVVVEALQHYLDAAERRGVRS